MGRVEGKVAIVSGSTSGIGEAVARRLSREGARVVLNSVTSVEAGERLAAELSDAVYVQADVADDGDCQRLVSSALDHWGRLDIVVNNAGRTEVIPHADLDAVTDDTWRSIFDTNVLGTWHLTRAAVPALAQAEDGNVINVSSLAGVRPTGSSIPYAVSKAAINHMTRLLAHALGAQVRVNAVAPGLIDTPWTQDWDEVRGYVVERAPLHRSGRPDDVAEVCLGLATSAYVTGEVVVVDGGLHLLVG